MPVEKRHDSADAIWGWWRISEDERHLQEMVPTEAAPGTLSNPLKRCEFLAGRALIKNLLQQWGLDFRGLSKDNFGKPYLSGSSLNISLSHSHPYVAAIIHKTKNVGIDLEQPKEKLLRIAPRILSPGELSNAGDDLVKHCLYWCAKETLVKIYGKKDLIFAENLRISPFIRQQSGYLIGRILARNMDADIPLKYIVENNFVVVVSD